MLKAIAIDDELVALGIIQKHARIVPFIELRAVFTHTSKALQFLQNEEVDLIFLDIKMPGLSGIDLLRSITDPPMVVFTTAYSEHAVESFELNALDYLLKPFSSARFGQACQKAKEQYELRKVFDKSLLGPPAVFIKSGFEQIRIPLGDILYVEASGSYVRFVLPEQKILSRLSLIEVQALLPRLSFVRIHRSYIAAAQRITKIEKNTVWIGEVPLPVSARFTDGLRNIIRDEIK
jgi:DNA-binding LytR/AlgR family response regulator